MGRQGVRAVQGNLNNLVLSVFPGIDLLGREFERVGYTILRGPDLLWGGDSRHFHPPSGFFEGVIGSPPCQWISQLAKLGNVKAEDLTYDFLRIVAEAQPKWAVMENVPGLLKAGIMPAEWSAIRLRDWDCGGMTFRTRVFWILPATLILVPSKRPGKPAYSVLAHSWKGHDSINKKMRMHSNISIAQAAELQGYPELVKILEPLGRRYAVHLLGNGVPKAMARFIAKAIKDSMGKEAK
ncbi:hypothetical protein ES703_57467 [subsurface metagenome]